MQIGSNDEICKNDKNLFCLSWCDADDVVNYGQILQGCSMMYILRQFTSAKLKYVSFCPRRRRDIIFYYYHHMNVWNGHLQSYMKTRSMLCKFIHEFNVDFYQVFSYKKANNIAKEADILICGSDQIWHPLHYTKAYFLDFDSNAKRISYACSLPKNELEERFNDRYTEISSRLRQFDWISVREKESVNFVSNLSGKSVWHVLDPTFLVPSELWLKNLEFIKTPCEYIFVYVPGGMDEKMAKKVLEIKEKERIKDILLLVTRGKNTLKEAKLLNFVSIGQFLYLIKNAKIIITSSFHGAVFSLIFHKLFFCYDVPYLEKGQDLRIDDLLSLFGLENRLLNCSNGTLSKTIDYDAVDNKLMIMRDKSWKYLIDSIQG